MCGIVGIFRHEGQVSAELYEGLLMLQHRGQDSAGMVTFATTVAGSRLTETAWVKRGGGAAPAKKRGGWEDERGRGRTPESAMY